MEEINLSICLGLTGYPSFAREYTEYDIQQRKADSLKEMGIAKYTCAK